MTPSDFAIVSLPPDLAARCGTDRVLVEAVEMHGAALVIGVARDWIVLGANFNVPPSAWINVPTEHCETIERLFVEARKQVQGPDYHQAWHAPRPASKPLPQSSPMTMRKARMMR